uniref:Uncharacterized protein n=3 Tax=Avena sativa TaxID=4498 RepID=A0ACD5ZXP2_AVESA
MSSFTGVSVITDGKHCTTSAIDTGMDSGYHLLVVKDYSRTVKETFNGEEISSGLFMVGGLKWYMWYCPNGCEEISADFISVYLWCDDVGAEEAVKVRCVFSFIDQVEYQKPMFIRATEPHSFSSEVNWFGYEKFMRRDAFERSTHLMDDCFTIRCDIMVCKDPNARDDGGTISDIGLHLDYLLQNKVGADVTFEVRGETFTAHRCVLAARSTVFRAQLFGPMREGTTSSVIQIKDMEAELFRALLSFIYTGVFPDMGKDDNMEEHKAEGVEEEEKEEDVSWLQALFVAADRYDLQRLKRLCEDNLSEHIGLSSVASTLALAEQHVCHGLKDACLKFIQALSPCCLGKVMETDGWEFIVTTYPSLLKEIITKVAPNQKDKKRKHGSM